MCDAALRPLAARLQADLVQREGPAGRQRHGGGQGQGRGREEELGQGVRDEGEEEQERLGRQGGAGERREGHLLDGCWTLQWGAHSTVQARCAIRVSCCSESAYPVSGLHHPGHVGPC